MGKTAKDIMSKAISYIGTKENPSNSNNVIFNTDYYGKSVSGASYPWCCSYVWDIFRMCGASELFYDGKKTAYCPTVESWGILNKLTVDKSKGQYGDIVLFDFYGKGVSCHIGFIESKNDDGSYTTIEGNTSTTSNDNGGSVMRRNRKQSTIRCIIRPKYSATTGKETTNTNNKATTTKKTSKTENKASVSYKVRVTSKTGLNVRKEPNTTSKVVDVLKYGDTTDIVEEKTVGNTKWGKLKSGKGWICLSYIVKIK